MSSRAEQKLQTRRRIIDAAIRLSGEQGFGTLSLREVTREAGLTPGAFYRHFSGMDELALTMVDEVGMILRQLMRQARMAPRSGAMTFQTSVRMFFKFLREQPNLFRILLGERSGGTPAFRKALHAEIQRFVGELAYDLESDPRVRYAQMTAEIMVAVVFTLGAEALDLPPRRRHLLERRLTRELAIIYRGAISSARPQAAPNLPVL